MAGLNYTHQFVAPAMAAQQEQLRQFWIGQMQEIHQVGTDPAEFKNHQLPLARIKKVPLPQSSFWRSIIALIIYYSNLLFVPECDEMSRAAPLMPHLHCRS